MTIMVRSVLFNGDGSVIVEFLDDLSDVKSNGLVFNQTALLPAEEYEDEIDAVLDAAKAMVESITADKERLGPPEHPTPPEDPDDE